MEEKAIKKVSVIMEEGDSPDNATVAVSGNEKFKKLLIFGLMAIVFVACLYLIFKPKPVQEENKDAGLKNAVPEATDKGLQADKQKAYEKEMVEEREEAKRNSLMSLTEYWNNGTESNSGSVADNSGLSRNPYPSANANSSLSSYQNAQQTLSSFYRDDDREKLQLRRQVDQLKERLSDREVPATPTIKDQLTLMEKSYEMASKYLPAVPTSQGIFTESVKTGMPMDTASIKTSAPTERSHKSEALHSGQKNIVSALYREPDDSSFMADLNGERNRSFITTDAYQQDKKSLKNSIRAVVMETKTLVGEGSIKLRLSESAEVAGNALPKGTEMVAGAKIQGDRLQLKITSVGIKGTIIPVEILVYGLDGQLGLSIPRSDELNAVSEIAANMSQNSGMNISMSRSAGQQVAADMGRGLIQGVSGFFSKKLRAAKVTLNAGHPVLLLTKK